MQYELKNNNYVVEYISDKNALEHCLHYLSSSSQLALDLEFDSNRYAYGFTICLIQVCTADRCFIIDPLAAINLEKFFKVLENPEILKILHAHGEDLRLLQSLGCKPANLFDTDIAAKLLNYEKTSLAAMLETVLGITLDKSQQKKNWLERPLLPAQLIYASNDVIHLAELMNALLSEAGKKNLGHWITEENTSLDRYLYIEKNKDSLLSPKDKKVFSPSQQFVLNEWLKYREQLAEKFNKPPYQVINPEVLSSIVINNKELDNWLTQKGVLWKLKTEDYKQLFIQKNKDFVRLAEEKLLSKELTGKTFLSPEEWNIRRTLGAEWDRKKAEVFVPIKEYIAQQHGKGAASFMLSNSLVDDLIQSKKKLSDLKLNYRIELMQSAANELNIDIASFL